MFESFSTNYLQLVFVSVDHFNKCPRVSMLIKNFIEFGFYSPLVLRSSRPEISLEKVF